MKGQDTNFNYKIIFAALVAVILAILIAFYYSYEQSANEINYLEREKALIIDDLTLMKAEVKRLSSENKMTDLDLEDSEYKIQQLLDSVGRLNFNAAKYREDRKKLHELELQYDSLKLKNNFLRYENSVLAKNYSDTKKQIDELRKKTNSLAENEAQLRKSNKALNKELRIKNYLKLSNAEGGGFRMRANNKPLRTNKASTVVKLRGCVTLLDNPKVSKEDRVIYFQFLGPNMNVIEDNESVVSVNGNTYSKRVELIYTGDQVNVCDYITVSENSLAEGVYTVNVFEDEKLLISSEFELK